MRKFFVSQHSLSSSRNRNQRRLEARLDKSPEIKFEKLFKNNSQQEAKKEQVSNNCPHQEYCNIKKFGRINCLFGYENCQTYKFYERYG